MSRLFSTTSDHLDVASVSVSDVPITISAWVHLTNTGYSNNFACIGESGTGNNQYWIGTNGSGQFTVNERDTVTSTANLGIGVNDILANWYLVVGVFTNHSSRNIYSMGSSTGSSSAARTASGVNSIRISGDTNATPSNPAKARIAHVAIWNTALSASQIDSLKYLYPNQVAVGNLVNYWPLTNNQSPEPDYGSGNLPLTVTGTTFSTDNPNIAGTLVQQLMGAIG